MDLVTLICTAVIILANIIIYIAQVVTGKKVQSLLKVCSCTKKDGIGAVDLDIHDGLLASVKILLSARGIPFAVRDDHSILLSLEPSRFEEIQDLFGKLGIDFKFNEFNDIKILEIILH